MKLRLRRKFYPVQFDVYDTRGHLERHWISGKDSTLTLTQPVGFTDEATGVVFHTVVTWRVVHRGVA